MHIGMPTDNKFLSKDSPIKTRQRGGVWSKKKVGIGVVAHMAHFNVLLGFSPRTTAKVLVPRQPRSSSCCFKLVGPAFRSLSTRTSNHANLIKSSTLVVELRGIRLTAIKSRRSASVLLGTPTVLNGRFTKSVLHKPSLFQALSSTVYEQHLQKIGVPPAGPAHTPVDLSQSSVTCLEARQYSSKSWLLLGLLNAEH